MEGFPAFTKLRIDWSEIDIFGHINNLAIMKYAQASRMKLLEAADLMRMLAEEKKGPILASVKCQFRKPLYYPGYVSVYSKVTLIKNTSFEILHLIYDEKNEVIAESSDIIVYYDFINNTKLQIPDEIRKKIEKLNIQRIL